MPESDFRRIVVPLDFSEPSRVTLAHAKGVAAWFGARLDLLHVVSAPVLAPAPNRTPLPLGGLGGPPELEEKLCRFAAAVPGPDVASAAHVRTGTPAARIVAFARQIRSDLIVIGTHGETGRRQARMGSVAEKVVRAAPCPVLTVKSFGKHLLSKPRPTATAAAVG
jgi:nucleotide-binding universal stress UspA family protein